MHLNLSQTTIILVLHLLLVQSQLIFDSPNLEFDERFFDAFNNSTRTKRQLFRGDIPHHRPLSGNHYAMQNGFPHPGRWADGSSSPYKIQNSANLPTPHQAYFDMLDGGRIGRYHTGIFGGSGGSGGSVSGGYYGVSGDGNKGVSYENELVHPNSGYGNDQYGPPSYQEEKPLYGAPPHVNVQVHNGHHNYPPPPPEKYEQGPKTVIHYHPIQYSEVLNIPENPQPHHHHHSSPPQTTNSYGPPNHTSGQPIGIVEGGFIPSKGIDYQEHVPKKPDHHHQHNQHHHHHESSEGPYRFDPFKIFSQSSKPHLEIEENEGPIAIPILAQFHTSKPIKFTKLKEPVHIIYRHRPPPPPPQHSLHGHHGYHGPRPHQPQRRPHFLHNFSRRPKMPPQNHPNWFFASHGL